MKIRYFEDTDTLYIGLREGDITETRELDENSILDLDANGKLCGLTLEHAKERFGSPEVSFEIVGAPPKAAF